MTTRLGQAPGRRTARGGRLGQVGWTALGAALLTAVTLAPSSPAAATGGTTTGDVATAAPRAAADALPEVHPTPQQISRTGDPVPVAGRVSVVAGPDTDDAAVALVRQVLTDAGARVTVVDHSSGQGKEVYVGTLADNPEIDGVLDGLGVDDATGLPADGYVLASGRYDDRPVVALNGVDARGTFYAVQTLRQLVQGHQVPGVTIRDWPLMSIRGAIEGFYGIPWSHQARLDQFAFYGRHKMNTYIYTPKDDRLLRAEWRTPYSGTALDRMRELVSTANANHVDFTFALSPGNDICYSSQADLDATIAKFDQLRELGVTSFYVALDDIPLRFHCAADREKYPNNGDWHWLADAQADYLNRIQREYVEPHHLAPLQTVPTNYAGSGEDPYKGEFGERLDDEVRVQWTGEGVFSDTITEESVTKAAHAYRTDHLYIWDNFPVNDGRRGRLFLNPLTGREPGLYRHIEGITSNPMIEPYASMPALANYGDYTWNGPAYDAAASMASVLRELAGPDPAVHSALTTFADLNQSWPYRDAVVHAPMLNADIDAFWDARADDDTSGTRALRARLRQITALPSILPRMAQPGFASDAEPWVGAAACWATALQHEVAMLDAIAADDGETATRELLAAQDWIDRAKQPTVDDQGGDGVLHPDVIVPSVGDGAFEAFTERAGDAYADWLGAEAVTVPTYPATASSSMGTYSSYRVGNMVDGDPGTLYWSNRAGRTGDWVQVDLGSVQEVGSVAVHQSDGDTETGDMFYDAVLEYSTDRSTWSRAGTFNASPLAKYSFADPVQARYVRLRATGDNPGGQWVKIREFQVSPPGRQFETSLDALPGQGPDRAFDADLATAYRAASQPVSGSYLARNLDAARSATQVSVVGTGSGEIQVRRDGAWTTVGELVPGKVFHRAAAGAGAVTGVRLLFTPGSAAPEIRELVLR